MGTLSLGSQETEARSHILSASLPRPLAYLWPRGCHDHFSHGTPDCLSFVLRTKKQPLGILKGDKRETPSWRLCQNMWGPWTEQGHGKHANVPMKRAGGGNLPEVTRATAGEGRGGRHWGPPVSAPIQVSHVQSTDQVGENQTWSRITCKKQLPL